MNNEKVIEELCETAERAWAVQPYGDPDFLSIVRAVLAKLAEIGPSEEMVRAWASNSPAFTGTGAARGYAREVFQTMLLNLLDEGKGRG